MNTVRRKKGFLYEIAKNKILYLMFLPVAFYFLIFAYLPMPGIIIAFKNFSYSGLIFGSEWNGLENFRYFFESGKLLQVTVNTAIYNMVFLGSSTVIAIMSGIFIAEMTGKYFKKVAQSFMFLPYFISWVTVAAFFYNIFNFDFGVLNTLLRKLSMTPVDIYSNPTIWMFLLPFFYIWKTIGFTSVLYLAAIMGIDSESYESAKIDGANIFQRIRHITLPALTPTIITLILLGISRIMRGEFDMFYQLVGENGLLLDKTDIIDTLVFRSLVSLNDFGMASAAGFYQSILSFVAIFGVNYLVKRFNSDYALF
ncbi:sugar ABC transporter permease [Paenibacillus psychroresistens]|uniref:Sugar ABC transporter permease n=1 Tax=Paenibacillus psychroresistens TaxID=1778678 RepID=A0A6B8RS67_9BACL|nr:ABC transporter permease subunit [Paenibacillus psychroresistens]QGQ98303.1 sugar ABC transporter permease [Paenibacillus psychroresistens]